MLNSIATHIKDTPTKHYILLDGLRGVAAIVIVLFHYAEILQPDFTKNILAHGFLAVDFFFCLSGFVMAYAYNNRVPNLIPKRFFLQRLIRLHPLVIVGSLLGLLAFLIDPYTTSHNYSLGQIICLTLASICMIPLPIMQDRYYNNFGLNAPSWSLFWEYIANILYYYLLVKISKRLLLGITIISALTLVSLAFNHNNLLGGWNNTTFWHGGIRMLFSFSVGMLIYKKDWIIKNKLNIWSITCLLLIAFILPFQNSTNWLTESFLIIIYFPIIIALGAGNHKAFQTNIFVQKLGQLSYPLYITHYSIMWIFGSYFTKHQHTTGNMIFLIIALFTLQIFIAFIAMQYVDKPIRKWLKNKYYH